MDATTVSLCTLVRGRYRHLRNQVAAIRQLEPKPAEYVVVWMGADQPLGSLDSGPIPRREVTVPVSGPLPLARARNVAAETAVGEMLVFLDVGCVPTPSLVGRYRTGLEEADGALVSGELRYLRSPLLPGAMLPGGTGAGDGTGAGYGTGAGRRSPSAGRNGADSGIRALLRELDADSRPHPSRPVLAPGTSRIVSHQLFRSHSFGVTADTFHRIGGFDEAYSVSGVDDLDFAFRARETGVPHRMIGGATAYHQPYEERTPSVAELPAVAANAVRFRRRWGEWPRAGQLEELERLGLIQWDRDGDGIRVVEGTENVGAGAVGPEGVSAGDAGPGDGGPGPECRTGAGRR